MRTHRIVKVWHGHFMDHWRALRDGVDQVPCGGVTHHRDTWFGDCEHTPELWDYVESARALCDETHSPDGEILEIIAHCYVEAWGLHKRKGVDHVESWPLALVVLAGLREAGYEVVRKE